jgi:hypothetical protein
MAGFELTLYGRIWVTPKGLELRSDQANFQIADNFSRKCIEPAEASFGFAIATGVLLFVISGPCSVYPSYVRL